VIKIREQKEKRRLRDFASIDKYLDTIICEAAEEYLKRKENQS